MPSGNAIHCMYCTETVINDICEETEAYFFLFSCREQYHPQLLAPRIASCNNKFINNIQQSINSTHAQTMYATHDMILRYSSSPPIPAALISTVSKPQNWVSMARGTIIYPHRSSTSTARSERAYISSLPPADSSCSK